MKGIRTNQSVIPQAEGEAVEFKSSFNQDAIVALVAFANTSGGSVYIGVNDRGGAVGVTLSVDSRPGLQSRSCCPMITPRRRETSWSRWRSKRPVL
jgi:ATP-dependent DNA helicase RecG